MVLSVLASAAQAQKAPRADDKGTAAELMRRVIQHKKQWRSGLDTYQAQALSRFVLSSDTSIAFVEETTSTVYWKRGRGPWEVVTARQRTADAEGYREAAPSYALNLYDDEIHIGGFRLIGPTHPDALKHYRFRIIGQAQTEKGKTLQQIHMTPTARLQPAFAGTLWVQREPAVLRKAALRPARGVILPPPVQQFRGVYRQRFRRVGKYAWAPANLVIRGRLDAGVPTIQYPALHFRQRMRFSNYRTNAPVPDSVLNSNTRRRVAEAVRSPGALQEALPRTAAEQRAFDRPRDARPLADVFDPHGFGTWLGPLSWWLFDLDVEFDTERRAVGQQRWQLLRPRLWYDRVDGFHLALAPRLNLGQRLRLTAMGGYETNLKQASYGGKAEGWIGPERQLALGASYRDGTDRRYQRDWPGARLNNGIDMLLGDQDYFDHFENQRVRGWVRYNWRPADLRFGVRLADEHHHSIATDSSDITGFDLRAGVTNNILTKILFGGDYVQRLNPSIQEGELRSVRAQLAWRDGRGPLGVRGRRGARLTVEAGSDAWGSDFAFTRYELDLNWRFKTFLARRPLPMTLDVYATAGASTGTLPPQRVGTLANSLSPYPDLGLFRTFNERPYEGEQWVGVFWMHDFRTVPFELLGWDWLVQRGLSLVVYGAHGRTWMSAARRAEIRDEFGYTPTVPDGFHHEIGLSLNGVLGLVHLDLTARLDEFKLHPGLGLARAF